MAPVSSLQFFMMPEEQVEFVACLRAKLDVRFMLSTYKPDTEYRDVTKEPHLAIESYLRLAITPLGARLDLRWAKMGGDFLIVERDVKGRTLRQMNRTASQSVLFEPAVIHDERELLSGTVAIFSRNVYQEQGFDYEPVRTLFRAVTSLLRRMCPYAVAATAWPDRKASGFVASEGARRAASEGLILRQLVNPRSEYFVIEGSNRRKRPWECR